MSRALVRGLFVSLACNLVTAGRGLAVRRRSVGGIVSSFALCLFLSIFFLVTASTFLVLTLFLTFALVLLRVVLASLSSSIGFLGCLRVR